jgi:hypothetical protein
MLAHRRVMIRWRRRIGDPALPHRSLGEHVLSGIKDRRRAGPQAATLRQQISTTVEKELRLRRGEAIWREWCSEWHATDPHLTAPRQEKLTRHVVDNLWGATDYGVSPRLRRNMMTAAKLAIRAHWPTSIASGKSHHPPRPCRAPI